MLSGRFGVVEWVLLCFLGGRGVFHGVFEWFRVVCGPFLHLCVCLGGFGVFLRIAGF